jgi:hypothetical protein
VERHPRKIGHFVGERSPVQVAVSGFGSCDGGHNYPSPPSLNTLIGFSIMASHGDEPWLALSYPEGSIDQCLLGVAQPLIGFLPVG